MMRLEIVRQEPEGQAYGTEALFFPEMGHGMMPDVGWDRAVDRMLMWIDEQVMRL